LHVFTYSERPGTRAVELQPSVAPSVRHERTRVLREISDRKNLTFRRRMIGAVLSAVTLEQRGMALTSNFLKVEMSAPREPNQLADLEIGAVSEGGLRERAMLPVI
jgi:threonylcarbamoyladenosine tRNA methylthiotransferase MtaB